MKDISKFEEYIQGYQLTLTEGENGAAKFHPNEFFPIDIKDSNMDVFQGKNGLIPIVLSSKGESFEGQLKGAVLTKGKTQGGELYDIGLSTLYNTSVIKDDNGKPIYKFFTSFKRPNAIATKAPWAQNKTISDMFTTLFPNKNEKIIVYCSSGSLASIEYFYLTEILDYKNVSIYDGSLMEWGNLTAFEPNFDNPKAGLHVVKADQYTWLPLYPMNMPAVSILASGESHPFHLEQKDSKFIAIDDVNGDTCVVNENNCWIKTGGTLKGDCRWDTLSKSEHILFRPTQKVNAIGTHEYNSKKDWVPVKVYPDYNGDATITKGTDAQ
jgi:rhodanese-related sulfurtransferase